jgi:hypothetical protein
MQARTLSLFVAALAIGLLSACSEISQIPVASKDPVPVDAEPPDPAEFRVQTMPPSLSALANLRSPAASWVSRGPTLTSAGQVAVVSGEITGAVRAVITHPSNADIVYVGAVNGGVWRTQNATAVRPNWLPLTDLMPSQSISALAFDPMDSSYQTILAGTGRFSHFGSRGDDEIGLYRSTNGGDSWSIIGADVLLGQKIRDVAARGSVLLVANQGGLYRSVNLGLNWTLISGTGGLALGTVWNMEADPNNLNRFYVVVQGTPVTSPVSVPVRVFRSDDTGQNWVEISAGLALTTLTLEAKFAIGPQQVIYLAISNQGEFQQIFRSPNAGASWVKMDLVNLSYGPPAMSGLVSIEADRVDPNIVFVGSHLRVVRGNFAAAAGSQFVSVSASSKSHDDSRAMTFDAAGTLIEVDDGGIYRQRTPNNPNGVWESMIGNLNVLEVHDLAKDPLGNVITIGTQDNGTFRQAAPNSGGWAHVFSGDGSDVAIDALDANPLGSFHYITFQYTLPVRQQFDAANSVLSSINMPDLPAGEPQFVTPYETNAYQSGRLLLGGSSTVFEYTAATAASPVLTSLGPPGANRTAIAYGSVADPSAAYVARSNLVYKRVGNAFVVAAPLPAGTNSITDVEMDPNNPSTVFALDDDQVFRSSNSGTNWLDITGNLALISAKGFQPMLFLPGGGLVIGSRSGVYYLAAGSADWVRLGIGMPDVLVYDLQYVISQKELVAGTLGRGVWTLKFDPDTIFGSGFEQ